MNTHTFNTMTGGSGNSPNPPIVPFAVLLAIAILSMGVM